MPIGVADASLPINFMHPYITAASSKHGATDEVADAVTKRREAAGFTVDRVAPLT